MREFKLPDGTITLMGDPLDPDEATTVVEARLAAYQQIVPAGTPQGNCMEFAQEVQEYLFEREFRYSYHGNNLSANLVRVGRLGYDCNTGDGDSNNSMAGIPDGDISVENVQALLSLARPGDVIQGLDSNHAKQHTMVVQRVTDKSITVYHGNWNSVVSITTWSFNYLAERWDHVITLYRAANYEDVNGETSVTVRFDANGGSCATTQKTVDFGSTYGTLPTPTRSGYEFMGWFTAKTGGTQVKPGDTVRPASAAVLYAHWRGADLTLTFDANGGDCSVVRKVVTNGETYGSLPTPVRPGYDFQGWYTALTGGTAIGADREVTLERDATVYARWKAKTVTITFDPNGGTTATWSKDVTYDGVYGSLPAPKRDGFNFQGWALPGGKIVSSWDVVKLEGDTILTAQWGMNFKDVPADAWYASAVALVSGMGLFNGTSDVSFGPDGKMTRAMFVTVLGRLYEQSGGDVGASGGTKFTDVPADQWYTKYVQWASAAGIVSGTGNNTFSPNANVTREQIAVILRNFAQLQGQDISKGQNQSLDIFTDRNSTSSWAVDAVKWAVQSGIIGGSGGKLNPGGLASRAEVAVMLQRYIGA